MLFAKFHSAVPTELEDPKEDYKAAKRVGQYKISSKAVYMPDGTYLPISCITDMTADKTSVHAAGCCAGGVPVERVVLSAGDTKMQLLFDSKREIETAKELLQKQE